MSWKRKNDGLLAKVNFPPYSLEMLTSRHVLVGGGGGSAKTGVANGFEIFELAHNGTHFVAEEVTRYETGGNVVMNTATYNNEGRKMWLAAGQESVCQLYNIQAKVVVAENGEIPKKTSFSGKEDLRQRRNSESKASVPRKDSIEDLTSQFKPKRKKLQLVVQPVNKVQTDFGSMQPVQRVVRISLNGKFMATGGTDGYIRLWKFPQLDKLHQLRGHDKEIDDIDFCPRSQQLATVAKDGKLIIWDVNSGSKIKQLKWNPSETQKSIFKRCRFQRTAEDSLKRPPHLFTLSNSLPAKDRKNKMHYGFLQLWDILEQGTVKRLVTYKEVLSELAVSDDGKFVAVGTMSTGSVDMFIAFSLQKVLHVPNAHSMFITNLEFLPTKLDGPAITSNTEAAVISCSVDNKICIHSIPYRHTLPFWLVLVLIIISICGAFILCSYVGI